MARVNAIRGDHPEPTAPVPARMRDHTRRISVLDVTFDVTTVWRSYNRQGYLERKLHLQWRSRGS